MNKYFKSLWKNSPLSWAIIRAAECKLLSQQNYIHPILEVGCGDGLVSQLIFENKPRVIDVGIDLDPDELRRAKKTGIYKKLLKVDITHSSFKNKAFGTVFANGVLEHIPNLPVALKEIERILRPNGQLISTSPTANYSKLLFYYRVFHWLKFTSYARFYVNFVNRLFAHHHLYSHEEWQRLLQHAGLSLEKYKYYNPKSIITLHDISLPFAILTKFIKKCTDQMVLFPQLHTLSISPFVKKLSTYLNESSTQYKDNASIFFIAKKL